MRRLALKCRDLASRDSYDGAEEGVKRGDPRDLSKLQSVTGRAVAIQRGLVVCMEGLMANRPWDIGTRGILTDRYWPQRKP